MIVVVSFFSTWWLDIFKNIFYGGGNLLDTMKWRRRVG